MVSAFRSSTSAGNLVRSVSSSYTITEQDDVVFVSGSSQITLPSANNLYGRMITIKKVDSTHATSILTVNSETIDNINRDILNSGTELILPDQFDDLTVISNGQNWVSLGFRKGDNLTVTGTTQSNHLIVTQTTDLSGNTTIGDSSSDALTINAVLQGQAPLIFEGASADAIQTKIIVENPTEARKITIPDSSGTISLNNFTIINDSRTLTTNDRGIVLISSTTNKDITITLPDPTGHSGLRYTIKKTNESSNKVAITGYAIDGAVFPDMETQYAYLKIVSDGSNWYKIGEHSICGCSSSGDSNPPVPGDSGTLIVSDSESTSVTLSWTAAVDNESSQENLEYLVCYSESYTNVNNYVSCEANTTASYSTYSLTTLGVSGLTSSTTYYFNVIVKDEGDNKALYSGTTTTTEGQTYINSLGMTFRLIPAGTFVMGSPSDELGRGSDETQYTVTISEPYYMQTTEVTQGQWKAVMGYNPSTFDSCGLTCPVESVSWEDAQTFIATLNAMGEGTYALPTEAQWEYAARAGSDKAFANGEISNTTTDPNLDVMGWYDSNSNSTPHAVAQKQANAWGLFDMHGNLWEWCQDWYDSYPTISVTDPVGPSSGTGRVNRGGRFANLSQDCRSANRSSWNPGNRHEGIGLRLLKILNP